MIKLIDVNVDFPDVNDKQKRFYAVKNVNLEVNKGEILGIVGYSGAGKSTLLRSINQLQKPTSGEVIVNNIDMGSLNETVLNIVRKNIGMIFQHSNLLQQLSVSDNVAFPLKEQKMDKSFINERVDYLLELVGLTSHKDHFPSQLSGGQKQRVSIARALANNPEVLLSDEATSALDPKTTKSILELLKQINREFGITIVLITHEMSVIKEICDRVAIMEDGEIIESGKVFDIFAKPKKELTKEFINSASQSEQGIANILENPELINLNANDKLIRIDFAGDSSQTPLISTLARDFQVVSNIHFGNIEIIQDKPLGTLLISLSGDKGDLERGIQYVSSGEVSVYDYTDAIRKKGDINGRIS